MNYFIVWSSQDRELGVSNPLTKEEALKRIEELYYGDLKFYPDPGYLREGQDGYGNGLSIIKGVAVMPQPVEKVVKYQFS